MKLYWNYTFITFNNIHLENDQLLTGWHCPPGPNRSFTTDLYWDTEHEEINYMKISPIHNSWFWCVLSPSDSHQLTLDLNTAHKHLRLSENNRVITNTGTVQSYPDHPDRFDECQVLCRESVCGRCYWEIEWSGDYVCISVSYKSIRRKGRGVECEFGSNDQSWSLICSRSSYSFWYNNIKTDLSVKSIIRRIGVFVDHGAGTLSFYSVSDTMNLIHTVQTTFTQTLYPGFGFGCVFGFGLFFNGGSVKLCWWIRIDW